MYLPINVSGGSAFLSITASAHLYYVYILKLMYMITGY